MKFNKLNKKTKLALLGGGVALVIIIIFSISLSACNSSKYDRHFNAAQADYLAQNYESAISNLEKALDIKVTAECYKLYADIYVAQGNLDMAINVLLLGYSRTGDDSLQIYCETLKREKASQSSSGETVFIGQHEVERSATNLVLTDSGLTDEDIVALADLTDLENLSLSGNRITDLSPLASLTKLHSLQLSNNSITDISALSALSNLRTLYLDGNEISDFSPLYSLKSLRTLSIRSIDITQSQLEALEKNLISCRIYTSDVSDDVVELTLGGVTFMSDVTELDLSALRLTDISVLAQCTNLQKLDLRNNSIIDISPLMELQELEWLCLWSNKVEDLRPLMSLPNLRHLDADANNITDISPLGHISSLEEVWLSYNNISSISPLRRLPNLLRLGLKGTGLEDSDLEILMNITTLKELAIDDNEGLSKKQFELLKAALKNCAITHSELISSIKIGSTEYMSDETEISASAVGLSSLAGLEDFTKLKTLILASNSISDLRPLSDLRELEVLDLYRNNVRDLSPLSGHTKLRSLNLSGNSISDISPLSGCTGLTDLQLSFNSISSISALASLSSLRELNLDSNSVSDVSALSGLSSLTSLNLDNNNVQDLTVLYALSNLQTLYIRGNGALSAGDIILLQAALPNCTIITDINLTAYSPEAAEQEDATPAA